MPPLISKEEIDVMDSVYEYDDEPISTDILEEICDDSKSHLSVNRKEAHYRIHDLIKRRHTEWKEALLSMKNMGKGLQKLF